MVAVAVIFVVIVIIYTIILFVTYSQDSWIFQPYVPVLPPNACEPLIAVIPLTEEEKARQQELLTNPT